MTDEINIEEFVEEIEAEFGALERLEATKPADHPTALQRDALIWTLRGLDCTGMFNDETTSDDCDEDEEHRLPRWRRGPPIQQDIFRRLEAQLRRLLPSESPINFAQMIRLLPNLEAQAGQMEMTRCSIDRTVDTMAGHCQLSSVEREVLRFRAAWESCRVLAMTFDHFHDDLSTGKAIELLSNILRQPKDEVRRALSPIGFFHRARLMRMNPREVFPGSASLDDRIQVNNSLLQILETANGDFDRLVGTVAVASPGSELSLDDFDYLEDKVDLVQCYLEGSLDEHAPGANILLYGPPGTGKTEFARVLAQAIGATAWEVKTACMDGETLNGDERRERYLLASQLIGRNERAVIIFDDSEESLGEDGPFLRSRDSSKAALNLMLEKNPLPTIWIANKVGSVESSIMRRFDVTVQFPPPPVAVLQAQLEAALPKDCCPPDWFERVAAAEGITPAVIQRLGRVARCAKKDKLTKLLDTSLETSRIRVPLKAAETFQRQYCNAKPGVERICGFVEQNPRARVLLHGPTGTGKTALAKHLAESTGLRPRMVRPSDILGPYVGMTEHNIAQLFLEANPRDELIILDEVESLAADRREAHRNWETSMVNEFLNRFDEYCGRVIACTNLVESIDPAIVRRFHQKSEVLGMNLEQRMEVVCHFAARLELLLDEFSRQRIAAMHGLAYGHVCNAYETAQYATGLDVHEFLQMLEAELVATEGGRRQPIGFTHPETLN